MSLLTSRCRVDRDDADRICHLLLSLQIFINMTYRTRTYIAGEWTGDSDAIEQLYKWNDGNKWSLHFTDAHKNKQCYDSSMPCTIKNSLRERMNSSKTFVLVVGNDTATTRKGSCAYQACNNKQYNYFLEKYTCNAVGKTYSTQSFIDYECQLAYNAWLHDNVKIVVLYNAASVNKSKCPTILKGIGKHVEMKSYNANSGKYEYDYQKVRSAIEG